MYDERLLEFCQTDGERETIKALIEHGSQRKAARALGKAKSTVNDKHRAVKERAKAQAIGSELDTTQKRDQINAQIKKKVRRYVVTTAQNATPVNSAILKSLSHYTKMNDAELVIIPCRYHNPTSAWTSKDESQDWWSPEIMPHLLDHRVELSDDVVLMGDLRVQPTAVRPTSGLETITGAKSAIIGHPKIELVTIPTPQQKLPKIIATTGAITRPNYTDSKAGKKGEHHHCYAALVIEVCDDRFHFRHINFSESGAFYDLDKKYTATGISDGIRAEALVLGDLHTRFADPSVVDATFDRKDSIVSVTRPKVIAFHDVLDFYAQNHHHRGKVFTQIAKHRSGFDVVENEIDEVAEFIDNRLPDDTIGLFVPSNHPDALTRWIEETDWRNDPVNAEFYLSTALAMVGSARMTDSGAVFDDPFVYWMSRKLKKASQCAFPARDESYMVSGIELSMHMDKGPNGSRGNLRGYGKIGVKSIGGHSHTPGIIDGAFQVGTNSRLNLEYTSGPSSWLHCDALVYPDGKRTLITIINGQWRA